MKGGKVLQPWRGSGGNFSVKLYVIFFALLPKSTVVERAVGFSVPSAS